MGKYRLTLECVETKRSEQRTFNLTEDQYLVAQKQQENNTVISSIGCTGYKITKIEKI